MWFSIHYLSSPPHIHTFNPPQSIFVTIELLPIHLIIQPSNQPLSAPIQSCMYSLTNLELIAFKPILASPKLGNDPPCGHYISFLCPTVAVAIKVWQEEGSELIMETNCRWCIIPPSRNPSRWRGQPVARKLITWPGCAAVYPPSLFCTPASLHLH